ncbi:MAG: NAD-glutamate dehydrogenase, partial [Pseudomonadota bacterium]|nr:NAD-glutamate dehydrogenase [Pseudomonadota bacterium]
ESDGFNRLVLELGVAWRDAALMRALARYRQQSGLDPRQAVQEAALSAHPGVTRLLFDLFAARFDPVAGASIEARTEASQTLRLTIEEALQAVESLDADRVLRRLAALVVAITRTNYYQADPKGASKPYIAFKVASRELIDLPAPKPFREIYVSAPNVEAVHLRFGPVARGGLRWSDRRDDFRTEVLGLVKAQQVKNAVIVPVGSKGGFYPKALPRGGAPEETRAEAISAYKTFLHGLLDLTDNIDADGAVVHPRGLVIHDADDPYLVVAADKGTASFSDIANQVAEDYHFWLGDAFASGGSVGYDHKDMAITSRGAWEAVKRHFRELGKDIQREPFTVAGIGDMSGDVFGNGMLLSKTIRLKAAFDHRHIFLDPDPDAATSWAERKRLFDLSRSSWEDYDKALISPGGGIFPRSLKSIVLTEPVKAMLDVKADALGPAELMSAILKSRVELLFLGGIGTYVKGLTEANLDVGDKANDAVRVNGRDLRCKVVGEGANLGFTQAGRIEFALAGGRIDTDAIDNSAGVDTSDHEVNIKILTGMAERAGKLAASERDGLLASMTDEIAGQVLAHNYDQTLALSLLEAEAAADLEAQVAFMVELESRGRLDRSLEGLPDAAALAARTAAGQGLTRPELAVLLAYGKLDLFDDIIAGSAPDDPYFLATLEGYFPKALGAFEEEMKRHRLRREIIATVIDNDLVNLCGPTFPGRLRAAAGCDTAALVTAFEAARQVLRFSESWARVERLDGRAPTSGQTVLFRELAYV